jgi:lysozyme family protein
VHGNFIRCFDQTEVYEGLHKFSNDPVDPGGVTFSGVTQRVYNDYRDRKGLSRQSVRLMTDAECEEIYETQYWRAVNGDGLPVGVDLVIYDIAVNSGPVRAIKFLQQGLGVAADGHLGIVTLAAVAKSDPRKLIQTICALRMSFWHSLSTWWRFGRGWSNRGADVQKKALAMVKK